MINLYLFKDLNESLKQKVPYTLCSKPRKYPSPTNFLAIFHNLGIFQLNLLRQYNDTHKLTFRITICCSLEIGVALWYRCKSLDVKDEKFRGLLKVISVYNCKLSNGDFRFRLVFRLICYLCLWFVTFELNLLSCSASAVSLCTCLHFTIRVSIMNDYWVKMNRVVFLLIEIIKNWSS